MTERELLAEQIELLEAMRVGLTEKEKSLHNRYMAMERTDVKRDIGRELDSLCSKIDAIGDAVGIAERRLYEIDGQTARRELLADAAYGRNP